MTQIDLTGGGIFEYNRNPGIFKKKNLKTNKYLSCFDISMHSPDILGLFRDICVDFGAY